MTRIATLRMIVLALIAGSCVVGGAVIFSASRIGGKVVADDSIATVFAAVAVVALLVQGFIVPRVIARRIVLPGDLMNLFATETLTRAALLEAAALLEYMAYLFTQDTKVLIAGAALVAMIAFLIPTERSFDRWKANRIT